MSGLGRPRVFAIALATAASVHTGAAQAQGALGAAFRGSVRTAAGAPIAGAQLLLTHAATGARRSGATADRGTFGFENLPVGGSYALDVRAVGYAPQSVTAIVLHLGDRVVREIVLTQQPHTLDDILVAGSAHRDAGSGGAVYTIPGQAVRNLPLANRNFTGLFGIAAQATGATNLSISGQHFKFNGIQVDGGTSGDFFGVNVTPGANTGSKSVSLESIEEVRVLVAPFDVRQGGFSGGSINVVTRSGTNAFRASSFATVARQELVGRDPTGARAGEFNTLQYGASVGGPIVRDRLHFFLVADVQAQQAPYVGLVVPEAGRTDAAARRAADLFRSEYGFDAGGTEAPVLAQPDRNLFLKLSWHASSSHAIGLTQTMVDARRDAFDRPDRTNAFRDGWQLSRSGSANRNTTYTTRLSVTSVLGRFSNEMVASFVKVDDAIESTNRVPLFLVRDSSAYIAGGSVKGAQDTETDQRVFELTNNVSATIGNHLLAVGGQAQLLHFRDSFFPGAWGTWAFASVDDLARRRPSRYEVALSTTGDVLADHTPVQLAAYLQDRWDATPRLSITAGLRYDVPLLDAPKRNPELARSAPLGYIDTSALPSGNGVISPRLGFAYAMGSRQQTMLRGGVGGFAGRAPYVWLTSAFVNTGAEQKTLVCTAAGDVPAPTTDIAALPERCVSPAAAPKSSITIFDPNYRFQQAMKYAIGIDQDVGFGLTASFDAIHTRTRNTTYFQDINLRERAPSAEGRVMFGYASVPTRVDTAHGAVYRLDNRSADRSTSLTAVLTKHWNARATLEVGYSWSRTEDLLNLTGNNAPFMNNNNPADGGQHERRLARSARDIPHNLVVTSILPLPRGFTAAFFLRARSGTPYAYSTNGDVNADGSASNDLAYIPRSAGDISLTVPDSLGRLEDFIEGESCLWQQRGSIMRRNSCRNPSVRRLDMRLAKRVSIGGQRTLEVSADVFNVANLLRGEWGMYRQTTAGETINLLTLSGWDARANRPLYAIPNSLPERSAPARDLSRWRMQLGARIDL